MIYIILIIIIALFVGYGVFWPHKNAIYKDKDNNLIKVIGTCKSVVTIVYLYQEETCIEKTNPMNIGLMEFIKTFDIWEFP